MPSHHVVLPNMPSAMTCATLSAQPHAPVHPQLGAEDVEDIVLKRSKRPGSLWLSCALQCFGGRKVVRDLEKRQSRAQMDLRKHSSVTAPGRAASFRSFTAEAPTRPVRRSSATSVRSEAMAKMATAPGRVPSLRSFTAEAQAPARPTRRSSATSARSETVGKKASEGTPSSVRTRPFHPMHLPPVSRPGLPPARSRRDLRPRADEAPESELGDFGAVVAGRAGSRGGLPDIGIRDERLRRVMEARQRRSRRMSQAS